jgi:hypothetical protein
VLINEDHLHSAARRSETAINRRRHVFDDARKPLRQGLFPLVKVDVESWRGNRLKAET